MLTRGDLQILVLRELRKAGFDVGPPRVNRRSELAEPESGFILELLIPLGWAGSTHRALIVCRQQNTAVGREVIESAATRLPEVPADVALVFASAFTMDALTAARERGVALLQIVVGRSVFASNADHYPAWLPAHLVQLVDYGASGESRARLLETGRAGIILEAVRP
jgi:hypothetical protein